ncbi:RNA-directed DNA polymerase, eukaryota, reverse transcriptase zinc-binding domain protein [Tanacetum coccineum]
MYENVRKCQDLPPLHVMGSDETNEISWVKWDSVLQSSESGGLGIGSLRAKNLGLLGKWWWRFLIEKNALWCRVISVFYGVDGGFSSRIGSGLHKSIWENVISSGVAIDTIGVPFRLSFLRDVKSGGETSFWNDIWTHSGQTLSSCFPRLYALESNKHCRVNERWTMLNGVWGGNWEWCSSPRGRTLDEVSELSRLIGNLVLTSEQQDGWRWKLNPNGKFTVNNLSKLIDIAILGSNVMSYKVDWNRFVPKKVNICIWRAVNDRLPTRANLLLRGLTISSSLCPLCGLEEESIHHIILSCYVVSQFWSKFWKWWHINHPPNMSSISDVLDFSPPISKNHRKIYQATLYVFIREIWSWRNRFVHADLVSLNSIRNEDIFTQAQLLSLLWISSTGIKSSIDWITWKSNPFSILLRVM